MKGLGSPPYTFFILFYFRFILKSIFKHQKIHKTFYILIFTNIRNLTLYKYSSKPWNLQNSLKSKILIYWPKMTKCQTNLVRKKIFHRFFGLFSTQNHSNRKKKILKIFHFFEKFDPKWPFLAQISTQKAKFDQKYFFSWSWSPTISNEGSHAYVRKKFEKMYLGHFLAPS